MIVLYNILQITAILLLLPLIIIIILVKPKYRNRIPRRLGFGLKTELAGLSKRRAPDKSVIWLHALSVGEITSAQPLLAALRGDMPDVVIIVTVSTKTGEQIARQRLGSLADYILPAPLDFLPTILRFIRLIQPDLFILVETDFWPNWLHQLKSHNIPLLLVNGRISESSFHSYTKFRFFFRFLFNSFTFLCMQTTHDAKNMRRLGVDTQRITTLGNLKYKKSEGLPDSDRHLSRKELGISENAKIIVAGSTHEGEEHLLLTAFAQLGNAKVVLLLAPRNIDRCQQVYDMAKKFNYTTNLRSHQQKNLACRVVILDTLGELADCYRLATLAFIGGSLVPEGGHNPLEAARCKIPVLFGPHMDDFREIAGELLEIGGAKTVHDEQQIAWVISSLLASEKKQKSMGRAAGQTLENHSDVMERHLQLINQLIA